MANNKAMQSKKQRKAKRSGKAPAISGLTTISTGFPDRFKIKQSYGTYFIGAPGAGVQSWNSFRGNSVFDPDFSGAGTTAFGYTQLSAIYNRYRVLGSKITVDVTNTGTVPLRISIVATIVNAPPTATALPGQRHIAQGMVGTTGTVGWKHTAMARTAAIFGVPESQVMSEDDFAGLVGGNPNNVWYWHVVMFNPGGVAGACNVSVRIEHDVAWSMPLLLAP